MSKIAVVPTWWSEVIELMLSEHCTLVRAASVTGHLLTETEAAGLQRRKAWTELHERLSREFYESQGNTHVASKSRLVGEMLDNAKRLRAQGDYKAASDVIAQAAKLLGYGGPETVVPIWAEIDGVSLLGAIADVRARRAALPQGEPQDAAAAEPATP